MTKQLNYQFKRISEIENQELILFYEKMYPERADFFKNHWQWLYKKKEYESIESLVVVSGNKVIGHAGLITARLRKGDEDFEGIWFSDLSLFPEYQGYGIGKALVKHLMTLCPIIMAFPNHITKRMYTALKWNFRSDIYSYCVFLSPHKHPSIQKRQIKILLHIASYVSKAYYLFRTLLFQNIKLSLINDKFIDSYKAYNSLGVQVTRSKEYLSWRLIKNPNHKELYCAEYESKGKKVTATIRIYDRAGYKRLHILSIEHSAGDESIVKDFVGAIIKWGLRNKVDYLWLMSSNPRLRRKILPMILISRPHCLAFYSKSRVSADFIKYSELNLECIDYEFDILYH